MGKEKNIKQDSRLKILRQEWKGLTKPTEKQLFSSTGRVVVITTVSAVMISVIDFGFTQMILHLTKLF